MKHNSVDDNRGVKYSSLDEIKNKDMLHGGYQTYKFNQDHSVLEKDSQDEKEELCELKSDNGSDKIYNITD